MSIYRVKVPIYNRHVYISFDREKVSKKFNVDISEGFAGITIKLDPIIIVFIDEDLYCQNFLTHESIHAAGFVLEMAGIDIDIENDEPLAYLAGWIAEEINKRYIKYNA